jgi:uncharacterized membrane protein
MIKYPFSRIFQSRHASWLQRHFLLVLILSSVLAMTVSLAIGLVQSVWFDEAYSIMLAKQPVGQLLHLTSVDTHPPLYYLLLKGWAGLFGWSGLALRSLSVLAMGGAVIFAGLLIRRMFDVRTALFALPFIAGAPFLLRFGFEIRMYALASLVGVAATFILIKALDTSKKMQWRYYATYAVLVALGVYTLYYMALLWIAHVVWLVWLRLRTKQPLFTAPWLLAYAGSVLLFLPWLPTFLQQVNNGALAQISQPLTLENLLGIVSFNFVYQPVWQLGPIISVVVLFVLVALGWFGVRAFKVASKNERPYLVLLAMYLLVPVILLALVSLHKPMYVERYLSHVAIGGMMFVGVAIAIVLRKSSLTIRAVAGLLVVVMLLGVAHLAEVGNYNFQRLQKPQIDQAAAKLATCDQGSMVLAADPYVAIELAYYLPNCQIYFYSEWAELGGGYAPLSKSPLQINDPVAQLAGSQKLFYVYYDEPKLRLPDNLAESSRDSFGPLTVAEFNAE